MIYPLYGMQDDGGVDGVAGGEARTLDYVSQIRPVKQQIAASLPLELPPYYVKKRSLDFPKDLSKIWTVD